MALIPDTVRTLKDKELEVAADGIAIRKHAIARKIFVFIVLKSTKGHEAGSGIRRAAI